MPTIANLLVKLGANTKEFDKKMSASTATLAKIGRVAAVAGVAVAAGLAVAAVKATRLAADMQQTRIAFENMLGSASAANDMIRELQNFAATTPFQFIGLAKSTRQMLAYGFAAEDVIPTLRRVGDAVAGLGGGEFEIQRIIRALGQMRAKGKVSAEEMMQIAELGIPAWKLLADSMGVGIPQAMKMAERGAISSSSAINAIVNGMGDQFEGMMEQQSKTFNGLMSTISDNVDIALTAIGGKFIGFATKMAGAVVVLTDEFRKWAEDIADTRTEFEKLTDVSGLDTFAEMAQRGAELDTELTKVIAKIIELNNAKQTGAVVNSLVTQKETLATLRTAYGQLLEKMRELEVQQTLGNETTRAAATAGQEQANAFASAAIAGIELNDSIRGMTESQIKMNLATLTGLGATRELTDQEKLRLMVLRALNTQLDDVQRKQMRLAQGIAGPMQSAVNTMITGWRDFGSAATRALEQVITGLIAAIAQALILRAVMSAFGLPTGGLGGGFGLLGQVFGLADGGIVNGPTLAMVGESGPEAVIPLSKMANLGGAKNQTIVIELDSEVIGRASATGMPEVLRLQGVTA